MTGRNDCPASLKRASHLFFWDDRHDEAVRICEDWLAKHPRDPWGYFVRGHFQKVQDQHVSALAFFSKAIGLGLDIAPVQFLRGESLMALGRDAEATAAFERVIVLDAAPRVATHMPHFLIAECCRRMGRNKEAIAWCSRIPDDFTYPGFDGLVNASKHTILAKIDRGAKRD
jgi:tetratricopeptide (TPR) repeat protein